MNFTRFYQNANKQLVEALSNMWFKGHPEEMAHFKELVSEREPLISEPVFQTIFPWKTSDFTFKEHASRLGILEDRFVRALDAIRTEEYRFPADRHPFTHQSASWRAMLDDDLRKTIVVTSGTGSGKTECFMIPVLQDLAKHRNNGVQAIFLYPLNALMSDQQKRIHEWCKALNIRYAIYNGDTIQKDPGVTKRTENYPRLLSRDEIRTNPPQILFTNPTLLNYMLVRDTDREILNISKGNDSLRWILLDEAHTYTGSAATELALQIRRVIDAFGSIEKVHFAVTSATIAGDDEESRIKLKDMVGNLTGKRTDEIEIIDGERVVPAMNENILNRRLAEINASFGCHLNEETVVSLREMLNAAPQFAGALTESILPEDATLTRRLELIDALGEKVDSLVSPGKADALLPARAHFMIRSINGLYTCTNPNCPDKGDSALEIGQLTTRLSTICPHPDCHAPMLEVVSCASCGELLIVGNNSATTGYGMRLNNARTDVDLFDSDQEDDNDSSGAMDQEMFIAGKEHHPCPRANVTSWRFHFNPAKGVLEAGGGQDSFVQTLVEGRDVCPHCGKQLGYKDIKSFYVGAPFLGQILSSTILDQAERAPETAGTTHYGQKFITFTDSRQATAKSAMAINQEVERTWIRTQIYQYLADRRMDNYSPGGLTPDEQEEYEEYIQLVNPGPRILRKIQELEAKMDGGQIPAFEPADWNLIKNALIGKQELEQMFRHIAEARRLHIAPEDGDATKEWYLNALFINQMGRIPRRANSLETLGLVRLLYPKIDVRPAPPQALAAGFSQQEWTSFLYICLNYSVRENFHYEIPPGAKPYCVQDSYTDPLFGPDATLTFVPGKAARVKKWPQVKLKDDGTPREQQDRLVLILCAALGYVHPEDIQIDVINGLLRQAWEQIREYALTCVESTSTEVENHGYKLSLTDPGRVKLSLIDKGWICPVEKAVVTDSLRGYSPRIKGYVHPDNFNRYRIQDELSYPFFPYPQNRKIVDAIHTVEPVSSEEIDAWIDANWQDKMEKGQFSDIVRDILNIRPIYITAEHSAQLSQAIREKSVKRFQDGILNVLACSTTMEMGVDISGISEVVMNTVPPKPANYLQRSGRAGRRGESKAMAVTFCPSTPIGNESWSHPDWPMTHKTQLPSIKMESRPIVQRHANALFFAFYVQKHGGMAITRTVGQFFGEGDVDRFKLKMAELVAKVNALDYDNAKASYEKLVRNTILETQSMEDCINTTLLDMDRVQSVYSNQVDAIEEVLHGLNQGSIAYTVNENKLTRVRRGNLLSFLAENAFLPSAGMPIGLVEFIYDYDKKRNPEDNEEGFVRKKSFPTKHISQAVTEYAPGNQVVINEWCYYSAGVGLKSPFSTTNRAVIQQCSSCRYTTVTYGNPLTDCPECGEMGTMHGVLEGSQFTEIIEPVSFNVDRNVSPSRIYRGAYSGYSIPKILNMPPWPERPQGAKYVVRASSDSDNAKNPEILFFNRGANGLGYAYCTFCGRMEPMPHDETEQPLAIHRRLDSNVICDSAQQGHIRQHVILAGRYQTDFVEIRFFDENDEVVTNEVTLYSLGVIITRKLGEILGINDGEIGFGLNADYDSIFIYDTAIGGAGYSVFFREYSSSVLDAALEDLEACDCEKACTSCLVDRRTQWSLDLLDRNLAIEWLRMEKDSRTASDEAIAFFGPSVWGLTCDVASQVCALVNSGNLAKLYFCLSTDISQWHSDDFPYLKLMDVMKRRGCETSFLIKNPLNLDLLRPNQLNSTLHSLMKGDFAIGYPDCGNMKPLMLAVFASGRKQLYFGSDLNRSFSGEWGKGQVFYTEYDEDVPIQPLDKIALLTALRNTKFVKHFRVITKRIDSNGLLNTIIRDEGGNDWFKVNDKIGGKTVTIDYTDKHLNSPLAVFLLVRVIEQLRSKYRLVIRAMNLHLGSKHDNPDPYVDEILRFFASVQEQTDFIIRCFRTINMIPHIDRNRVQQHERDIIISDGTSELSILPNGGIAWGWTLDDTNVDHYTKNDLLTASSNPRLYNFPDGGITYTVVLSD